MPLTVSRYGVVFDLDGLMVDSESLAFWAWDRILAEHGHALDEPTFAQTLGRPINETARFFCRQFKLPLAAHEAAAERRRLLLDALDDRLAPMPGLLGLLDELKARRLSLGVGSSAGEIYVHRVLEAMGLAERFDVVVTGDQVARGKPDSEIFLLTSRLLGVPPELSLALEDSPAGAQAAVAAGMTCVAVPNRWTAQATFPTACRRYDSLKAVREGLDDLIGNDFRHKKRLRLERYVAAGGIVVRDGDVLVLERSKQDEIRLPKGHVEPGETPRETALRETAEESGYRSVRIRDDLGVQEVMFTRRRRRVLRAERYFLMHLADPRERPTNGEAQFDPVWLPLEKALDLLTFEAERDWLRRARLFLAGS